MAKTETRNLVILGAGGFAREVAWLAADMNRALGGQYDIIGFWDREESLRGRLLNGIPVLNTEDVEKYLPDLWCVAGIGNPEARERAVTEAEEAGCRFATLVHPSVMYDSESVRFGPGAVICSGNILTVNITIGSHVHINLDCTVGHDSIIEDFVTISPGCHLSGFTTIGRGAFLGTGAVTIEHQEIGERAVVGAGGVVVTDIPPGATAVGVPAKTKEQPGDRR